MNWGLFQLAQIPDQSYRVEAFENTLQEIELADQLGWDSIWVAEHLFSTYGICASTQVWLAAAAQRTKRVRLGSAIAIIPFGHPLRIASDFALIDVMSNGRLEFGVGRAYQPHEFAGLGLPMDKSRQMFEEGMKVIVEAWTQERVLPHGEFWNTTHGESVELLPKPVQDPHPPIWHSALSPPSFQAAADHGWHVLTASPFSYRMHRERWKEALAEEFALYEERCVELGRDPKQARRGIMVPFFCANTEAEAKEAYGPYVEWFYNKVSGHEQVVGPRAGTIVPGYEMHQVEGAKTKAAGLLAFEHLHGNGAAIASDPDGCISALTELKDLLGLTDIILWFNLGGISTEIARESMKLATEHVLPHVDAAPVAVSG